jgi:formylglycine-generating enzyme required for sulfatase activity
LSNKEVEEVTAKLALVIANTEYQDANFAKLTAPGKDAEEFAHVLRDAELAAFEDVQVLLNEGESKIRRSIARFFAERKRDDLLLLYFSGHGIRNGQGQLFLAANDTEINILEATGIPADFITYAMNNSRSQRQLLILDCCNSGAFSYGSKSASAVGKSMGIATAFEGSGFGRVVLTATDATQFAWEGDKVIGDTQKSVFTHFLIEGLKGEADRNGDGRIDVDELYDYAFEEVVRRTPKQTPGKWSYRQQGDIVLRENLKPRDVKPASLPSDLLELLSHQNSGVRKVGIQDLINLLEGKHLGLARAAEEKLREIAANDDSFALRKAASDTLIAHGLGTDLPAPITTPPIIPIPVPSPNEEKSEIEQLASQAFQYELKGDFWNALQTYHKIKQIDPLYPQVDIKITELEKEVHPKPIGDLHQEEDRAVKKLPVGKPFPWHILGFAAGGMLLIVFLIWGASKFLGNPPLTTPELTGTLQTGAAFSPQPSKTITSNPEQTNTPSPSETSVAVTSTLGIGSVITGKDGMTLLYVPAGEFMMGSDSGDAEEKPVHTVYLDAFWIDKTDVTNAMFAKFMGETGHVTDAEKAGKSWVYQGGDFKEVDGADWSHPLGPSSGISGIMSHPVVHVSWNDAQAYCSWANRRLPTEAEWEKAARGKDAFIYPWGSASPNNDLLNYNSAVEDTTEVGKYPAGASPYGALDMAGNVWEWVDGWYDAYPGNTESNSSYGTTYRVVRGGSWFAKDYYVRSTVRRKAEQTYTAGTVGFRCVSSP